MSMELIDDLKKLDEIKSIMVGLQEGRLTTLSRLLVEVEKARAINENNLILSDAAISLIGTLEQLATYIEEGVAFQCAMHDKIGLPPFHLVKEFTELVKSDRDFIARLGVRQA